ncbi:MAG: hypothetical protein Kow0029_05690 [Candidatus Rifleibacteriota bacterium]
MRTLALLITALILMNPLVSFAGSIEAWKDQVLYFVLIDRFYDGDKLNNFDVDKNDPFAFHGGDVKGLIQKLDYLDELGVTGIWLSPFFENRGPKFFKHSSYHGYWVWDFWKTDPRFGSLEDLITLRKKTRDLRMKLIFDMVVNHMGYDAPFAEANPQWFNQNGNITNWNDPAQLVNYNIFGLPDFASHKPVVKTFFELVGRHWIEKLQPDGLRLDAVKHVPIDFWSDFNDKIRKIGGNNFLLLGEYLDGDPNKLLETLTRGKFISMFDFPLYYTIREVFAEGQSCKKLASRLYFDRNYPDAGMLATFIDNHDLDRFYTLCGQNLKRYLLALSYIMTVRGIPTLCYGDEQALAGKESPKPFNRRDMIFDPESQVFDKTRRLISIRKNNEPFRRGLHCHLYADDKTLAYARLTPDGIGVAVFNNSSETAQIDIPFPFRLMSEIILPDKIGKARAVVREGRLETTLPAYTCAIFVPCSQPGFYAEDFRHWQRRLENEDAWGKKKVTVRLKFDYVPEKVKVFLTGNCRELGNWDTKNSVPMMRTSDDEFEASLKLPLGKIIECKCFYRKVLEDESIETVWQNEDNSIFEIKDHGSEFLHIGWRNLQQK